ncbi:hypothetical protein DEO72_LG4g2476 [Vigna unguiculata]|uniref:Uncharacterized protein n=1 Tax=Vigna unguiculata TaxID=3917 RepID=A0A4D6LSQ5_VIGUN|nr:hypothetical protein DEO72_LG4g2476 [Vigna unguiculata]
MGTSLSAKVVLRKKPTNSMLFIFFHHMHKHKHNTLIVAAAKKGRGSIKKLVPPRNALLGLEGTESADADEVNGVGEGELGEGAKGEGGDEVVDGPELGPGPGLGLWEGVGVGEVVGDICGGRVKDVGAGEGA